MFYWAEDLERDCLQSAANELARGSEGWRGVEGRGVGVEGGGWRGSGGDVGVRGYDTLKAKTTHG